MNTAEVRTIAGIQSFIILRKLRIQRDQAHAGASIIVPTAENRVLKNIRPAKLPVESGSMLKGTGISSSEE